MCLVWICLKFNEDSKNYRFSMIKNDVRKKNLLVLTFVIDHDMDETAFVCFCGRPSAGKRTAFPTEIKYKVNSLNVSENCFNKYKNTDQFEF